jgi:hypothetical protein
LLHVPALQVSVPPTRSGTGYVRLTSWPPIGAAGIGVLVPLTALSMNVRICPAATFVYALTSFGRQPVAPLA